MNIFSSLSKDPDLEWEFTDGSIVKAHQHSAGAASQEIQGAGDSLGGKTTNIHMVVDGFGLPIVFHITGAHVNDCTAAPDLIDVLPQADYVISGKGYDSEVLR